MYEKYPTYQDQQGYVYKLQLNYIHLLSYLN